MQIDGHHTLTYVVARYAGLEHEQAERLAYCAQYVDEATNSDHIHFNNGAMFDRIASAHKMLDYRNTDQLANHLVWIPFHFLPGNANLPADSTPEGSFIQRLICLPDSPVARDMLKTVGQHWGKPYDIHLLGVALHVYADTFAHQGFAGVVHNINNVDDMDSDENTTLIQRITHDVASWSISNTLPLGHGASLSLPDRPYIKWSYTNGAGQHIVRDNTQIFVEAANAMYKAIRCFIEKDKNMNIDAQPDLSIEQKQILETTLAEVNSENGTARHQEWLSRLSHGYFGFDPVDLTFITHGDGSWKKTARGEPLNDCDDPIYQYSEEFLRSDWKLFHDALKTYRLEIIRDVLPQYGICVA